MREAANETFEIRNEDTLEASAATLARLNQEVVNDTASLQYILNQIKEAWVSTGADAQSFAESLQECINRINTNITPTVSKFVSTMNTLVANTRANKSNRVG